MQISQIEVQKYGGTSVGDFEKISKIAQHIKKSLNNAVEVKKIVAVVSAMNKNTDKLIAQARELAAEPDSRELDQLMHIGEIQTAALLATKLLDMGVKARSFTASQIGLKTSNRYGNAAIFGLRDKGLVFRLLERFDVLVITGFQGIAPGETIEITTVGRGGSDAIAVALAIELEAACVIYTDVDGVYAVDPRVVENARRFKIITPNQMIKMYKAGAGVMMGRSVEIAQRFNKPVRVKLSPSFGVSDGGTEIKNSAIEGIEYSEYVEFAGLGIKKETGIIKIAGLPDVPGTASKLFKGLEVNIMEIIQPPTEPGELASVAIILRRQDMAKVVEKLNKIRLRDECFSTMAIYCYEDLVTLTLVDLAMIDSMGYIRKMLAVLAEKSINVESIFSAEDKLGVVVREEVCKKAAQVLATEFGLTNKS